MIFHFLNDSQTHEWCCRLWRFISQTTTGRTLSGLNLFKVRRVAGTSMMDRGDSREQKCALNPSRWHFERFQKKHCLEISRLTWAWIISLLLSQLLKIHTPPISSMCEIVKNIQMTNGFKGCFVKYCCSMSLYVMSGVDMVLLCVLNIDRKLKRLG